MNNILKFFLISATILSGSAAQANDQKSVEHFNECVKNSVWDASIGKLDETNPLHGLSFSRSCDDVVFLSQAMDQDTVFTMVNEARKMAIKGSLFSCQRYTSDALSMDTCLDPWLEEAYKRNFTKLLGELASL